MKGKGVWIPGNVASSKNSKIMIMKEDKKPLLINSKTVEKYKKKTKLDWLEQKDAFRYLSEGMPLPMIIGFHFVRGTRHKYDWINILQLVQDLMVEYGWIEDDNIDFLIPIPFKMKGSYSSYDKEKPGCWIVPITQTILEDLKGNIND